MVEQINERIIATRRQEDLCLAQRVANGDLAAWEILYHDARPKVERFALKYGARLANELVDEAFDIGYCCISKFRGKSRFSNWINGIVYHKLMDRYHDEERTKRLKIKIVEVTPYCFTLDPLNAMLQTERNRAVWRAFFVLPEQHRLLIEHRVLLNESYKEMSATLGMGLGETIREYKRGLCMMKDWFIRFYEITPPEQ